jgi:hypothetical protein
MLKLMLNMEVITMLKCCIHRAAAEFAEIITMQVVKGAGARI